MNRTVRNATLTLALIASLSWGSIAHAQTFTNSSLIEILDDVGTFGDGAVGQANPYPSPILVSGVTSFNRISVTLHNIWHGWMRDIDILLIGPTDNPAGIRSWSMLMSDVGGQAPGVPQNAPITLTFSDFATNNLTFGDIPSSGVYKPINAAGGGEEPDQFPGTGLQVQRPVSLATFNNTNANGTWRLYVVDDGPTSVGQIINGWSINFSTVIPEPTALSFLFCGALVMGGSLIARRRRD